MPTIEPLTMFFLLPLLHLGVALPAPGDVHLHLNLHDLQDQMSQSTGFSNHESESDGIFLAAIAALLVAMSAVAIAEADLLGQGGRLLDLVPQRSMLFLQKTRGSKFCSYPGGVRPTAPPPAT